MAKNVLLLKKLFLLGMALTVVGFILPVFSSKLKTMTGLDFINFKKLTNPTYLGAFLVIAGAAAGVVFEFVRTKNPKLIRLICLVLSITGGIIFAFSFGDNPVTKFIGKNLFKHSAAGLYMIIAGWVIAVAGLPSSE